jgi:hypothetical protein
MGLRVKTTSVVFLFYCLLLSGCIPAATTRLSSNDISTTAKSLPIRNDAATVYIIREGHSFYGKAALYRIMVNGYEIGDLANDTFTYFYSKDGNLSINTLNTLNNYYEPVDLNIKVKAGKKYFVKINAGEHNFIKSISEQEAMVLLNSTQLIYIDDVVTLQPNDNRLMAIDPPKPSEAIYDNSKSFSASSDPQKDEIDVPYSVTTKPNAQNYAVVIGIENYRQKLPKADHAANDATVVSEYLSKSLGYPEQNIITITNDHAAKSDLEKYLNNWLKNKVDKDSNVFIYYSGHGAPNPKTGDAYLVPYDGDPAFIDETGYSLKRLYDNLALLPAKQVIVALDSCFSGAGGKSVAAPGSRALVRVEKATAQNIVVMTASADDQISSTYMDKGHGIFTYFLLKGIKESLEEDRGSKLEVADLYAYLKPQVERMSRKKFNSEQTPQLITANDQMRKIGLR